MEGKVPIPPRKNDTDLPKAPADLTCPSCGSSNIAVFLYGLPGMSEELDNALKKQQVTLGGCPVYDGAPQWACNTCKNRFGKLRILEEE